MHLTPYLDKTCLLNLQLSLKLKTKPICNNRLSILGLLCRLTTSMSRVRDIQTVLKTLRLNELIVLSSRQLICLNKEEYKNMKLSQKLLVLLLKR